MRTETFGSLSLVMADLVRLRVVVSGRVQGVWFRETMRRVAEGRGVSGWVRNVPDGTVEAVLEGSTEAVEAMLDWCRIGPRDARVDDVVVADEMPQALSGFDVG
jgi:acylphosphatase